VTDQPGQRPEFLELFCW